MKNKQQKRQEAEIRSKEYKTLDTKQKLVKLNLQIGDKGATKQRAKLADKLVEESKGRVPKVQTGGIPGNVGMTPVHKKKYQKPKRS